VPPIDRSEVNGPCPGTERLEPRLDVRLGGVVPLEEELLERSGRVQHVPQDHEQRRDVATAHPPVHEPQEPRAVMAGIEAAHERRGRFPHRRERSSHRRLDAGDAAERQARGDERGDLAIGRVGIGPDAVDGVFHHPARAVLPV